MTMAACYASYDMSIAHGLQTAMSSQLHHSHPLISSAPQQSQQLLSQHQLHHIIQQQSQHHSRLSSTAASAAVTSTLSSTTASLSVADPGSTSVATASTASNSCSQKDYTIPLHVDCSVEYELPNQPKPPAGQRVEPLLMIHPCYFRKMESQRRSPFVNNMPNSRGNSVALLAGVGTVSDSTLPKSVNINILPLSNRRVTRQSLQQSHQQQTSATRHKLHIQAAPTALGTQYKTNPQLRLTQPQQQQQMSQMSQQAHYPAVSISNHHHQLRTTSSALTSSTQSSTSVTIQYNEPSSISRISTATHHHNLSRNVKNIINNDIAQRSISSQQRQRQNQTSNHQNLVVHNSSFSTLAPQWDELPSEPVLARTSMASHKVNMLAPAVTTTQSLFSRSITAVGKRDALISGGSIYGSTSSLVAAHHNNNTLNVKSNSNNKHSINIINQNNKITHCLDTSGTLVDASNSIHWDAPPSSINSNSALIIDRSSMATVPSNFQAGPDTTPVLCTNGSSSFINHNTLSRHYNHHYTAATAVTMPSTPLITNGNRINREDKLSGKYRQYLHSQRLHPYFEATSGAAAATSTSHGQIFPQFTAATAATATPSFQQLQQISCYNV